MLINKQLMRSILQLSFVLTLALSSIEDTLPAVIYDVQSPNVTGHKNTVGKRTKRQNHCLNTLG